MFALVVRSSFALLAVVVTVATATGPSEQTLAQRIGDPEALKQATRNLAAASSATPATKVREQRSLATNKGLVHRRKRSRRSLLRGSRRRDASQEYYPQADEQQYLPRSDQRDSNWNVASQLEGKGDNALGSYEKLAEDPYNSYSPPVQDADDGAAQRAEYDAERTAELEASDGESAAYDDYSGSPGKQKRQAAPESVEPSRGYSGDGGGWKVRPRSWERYRNKRGYQEGSRDQYPPGRSYLQRGAGSKFFSPDEQQQSDNNFGGYAQEVVGQDGFVEHVVGEKK
ncbi:uncharacterized protein LOC135367938 [Ornithodoros turicata]|uniref:uncharacterized protein LOC135367938 n=1 Tax=Ornithodoros turicata TaxID=34597 RepID=UPI003139A872